MVITYYGGETFKVQFSDTVVAFNPAGKGTSMKTARFGADIALVSLPDPHFNGSDQLKAGEKAPFVISGPGEYEIKGIFIKGFQSHSHFGGEERINTIYTVNMENMQMCFLGAISDKEIPGAVREGIGDVDVLFVPVGGKGVLSPSDANTLAVSMNAKIIVPMHYGDVIDSEQDALKTFLKEAGSESAEKVDKLTLKTKDLADKEGEVVVVVPTNA